MSFAPNSELQSITATYCTYEQLKEEEEGEGRSKSRRSSSISSHSSYTTNTPAATANANMHAELLNGVVFLPDNFANVESPIVVDDEVDENVETLYVLLRIL